MLCRVVKARGGVTGLGGGRQQEGVWGTSVIVSAIK